MAQRCAGTFESLRVDDASRDATRGAGCAFAAQTLTLLAARAHGSGRAQGGASLMGRGGFPPATVRVRRALSVAAVLWAPSLSSRNGTFGLCFPLSSVCAGSAGLHPLRARVCASAPPAGPDGLNRVSARVGQPGPWVQAQQMLRKQRDPAYRVGRSRTGVVTLFCGRVMRPGGAVGGACGRSDVCRVVHRTVHGRRHERRREDGCARDCECPDSTPERRETAGRRALDSDKSRRTPQS